MVAIVKIDDADEPSRWRKRVIASLKIRVGQAPRRCGPLAPLYEKIRAMAATEDPPVDQVLDASGAAHLLKVSTKTVLRLARAGELPARKVGREWRFEMSALLDHVARRVSA